MTTMPFTCATFADHLADHLESDAAPATRAAMDAHAAECGECRALLADIEAIRKDAAALPLLTPSRDLWAGIEARIEAPVVDIASGVGRRASGVTTQPRPVRRWWAHPAVAAAALVGVTATVTHYATREAMVESIGTAPVAVAPTVRDSGAMVEAPAGSESAVGSPDVHVADASSSTGARGGAQSSDGRPLTVSGLSSPNARPRTPNPVAAPVSRRPTADVLQVSYRQGDIAALDSLYYREIIRLRQVLGERRGQLDSSTVAVIDRNMLVIDRAIQECRAALAADPASKFLNQQLNEALESKIELLRTAAMMPVGS